MAADSKIIQTIDKISDWSGRIVSYLIYPMVGSLAYEVFARYLFHAPTDWAYDVTYMFYGTIFMLGASYTLLNKGHIRTDMFYGRWKPQTQGKIERYHRSMKSLVKLDLYYSPSELEQAVTSFVRYYNEQRYHEALDNVTPADMYFGRYTAVMTQRERIKQLTLQHRREHYLQATYHSR